MSGLIVVLVIHLLAVVPAFEQKVTPIVQLTRVHVGAPCATAGSLARAGKWLVGCKRVSATLKWSRTPARIAKHHSESTITTAASSTSDLQRHAIVSSGEIVGMALGTIILGGQQTIRTLALDPTDPAQIGDVAGSNRFILDEPSSRLENLTTQGCIKDNCGLVIRDYALLSGSQVLNVIVWDGRPLLGSGTPIVGGITIMERKSGEPIGPGTQILKATRDPYLPATRPGRSVLVINSTVVAVIDGVVEVDLPSTISHQTVDNESAVAPGWQQAEDGSFYAPVEMQPTEPGTDGSGSVIDPAAGGSAPGDTQGAPTSGDDAGILDDPNRPGTIALDNGGKYCCVKPKPWVVDPGVVTNRPVGDHRIWAIIGGGKTINVIVLEPNTAGGQSWIEWFNSPDGRAALGSDAMLAPRQDGDFTEPGHDTIIGTSPP